MSLTLPRARVYGSAASGGGDPRAGEVLHVDGLIFRYPDGTPHRVKNVSQFRAMQRRQVFGEDVSAITADTKAIGGNRQRVFAQFTLGMTDQTQWLRPEQLSPAAIADYARYLLAQSLRVEVTILADCDALGMGHAAQVARVRDVCEALRGMPNVSAEICNEPFQNGADVDQIVRDLGYDIAANRPILLATGKYTVEANPAQDFLVLDIYTQHPEREPNWPNDTAKDAHFSFDGWGAFHGAHTVVALDEPIGATNDPNPDYGRRDNRVWTFEGGGGGYGVGCGWATFHSDSGIASVPLGATEQACGIAFFAGMDFFPPDACTGEYCHDGLANQPIAPVGNTFEAAGRVFANRAYIAAPMAPEGWEAVGINGWRVTKTNARGTLIWLER